MGSALRDVPVAPGATLAEAIGGGEDYELVIAVGEDDVAGLLGDFSAAGLREPIRIGTCTSDPARRTLGDEALERLGWQHRLG